MCCAAEGSLERTGLGRLGIGDRVNLERPLRFGAPLGGHLVLGHVDGVGTVKDVTRVESTARVRTALPGPELAPLLVPKGSVAVDGVGLTVAALAEGYFEVMLIPHTLEATTLGIWRVGQPVNIEVDVIGKYLLRSLEIRGESMTTFARIEEAIEEIRQGRMLLVVDDEDRENEGDFLMAADKVTPEAVNFMLKYGRGILCMAMTAERLDELQIPMMVSDNTAPLGTAFTQTVDARRGVTTGTSAYDRAVTIRTLVDPDTRPDDLTRPGHVNPLRAMPGGVLRRAGHTEAAVDLARLAGCHPAGVICEVLNDEGGMARMPYLAGLATGHGIKMITIKDLIAYRTRTEKLVRRVAEARLPSEFGEFRAVAYETTVESRTPLALVMGEVAREEPVLVRMHSECLPGDVFHSQRCDCGLQLRAALEMIQKEGRGVVVYLRQEGRGIGLLNKLRAYALQDSGLDTVEANEALGFKPDQRDYGIGAQVLVDLGVKKLRLLTNNPRKRAGLDGYGLLVAERVPIEVPANPENQRYLSVKRDKLGHLLSSLP